MVREIIHLSVGQCGNQVGTVFWDNMRLEHKLGCNGQFEGDAKEDRVRLDKINVFFKEVANRRFVPRAVLVDLEPNTLDVVKASHIGSVFKHDNFIFGASGAGNNWAKGHYTEGAEIIDEVMEIIRKEIESCDCPQAVQMTHSLGGGTGAGLGTLMLLKCRDQYPDRLLATYSVFPSPKVSDVVVEPYNATLSIHQLLENSDETFVIDNEALFNISHNVLKHKLPRYVDLNWMISLVMSGITSSLRFPGLLNGDMRKMGVNLVPFPRLHFFLLAQAPLFPAEAAKHYNLNIQEVTSQMWSSRNFLAHVKPQEGKYLTATTIYRQKEASTQEIDQQVSDVRSKMDDDFVRWIPHSIKTSIVNVPPLHVPVSGTFVANTTSIKAVFERISGQFAKMYKRKAFLHWYKGEGMDITEFEEADKNVRDLVLEYQDKQDAVVPEENEEEDNEDDVAEEEEEENDYGF